MDYSLGYFSDFAYFFKKAIIRKIEVGISRQTCYVAYLHQYVSENVIKIWGDFGAIF